MAKNRGCATGPYGSSSQTSTLRNADSWAMFASVSYFQTAWSLVNTPQPDCSAPLQDYEDSNPEGTREQDTDRPNPSYGSPKPPAADPASAPGPDGPVPAIPYNPSAAVPSGLANPFPGAEAYFSSVAAAQPSSATCSNVPSGCTASPPGCVAQCP
ncbi:hypothetical protein GP486_005388 [Trichoglossum hirsutum]|uniref:Uncharacterized protein n=1 Tax=Trichoglossum hirsutum TaxID=265104 RepID=A0A9P8RMD0_9PEZI|nr:hypothetical protein GP486_005388 [Trichoglossum hirsutum]